MEEAFMIHSGRRFSQADIGLVEQVARECPGLPVSRLAEAVCGMLGWETPAGKAKLAQCLGLLRRLDSEGRISLPPESCAKTRAKSSPEAEARRARALAAVDTGPLGALGEIAVEPARKGPELDLWTALCQAHHRLGYTRTFGARLHYLARSGGRVLGCLSFSGSAWALEARDSWIGWGPARKAEGLRLIVNNSRFLILPWAHERNLASRILSAAARRLPGDWLSGFGYKPVLLETFVDAGLYRGTSYRAANWICLGETKGRGRMDRRHSKEGVPRKLVFALPLRRDFREILNGGG